jgi:hypothetical protein
MPRSRSSLWLLWAVLLATLAVWLALPRLVAARPAPWSAAEAAVAGFVLAIFGLVGGVWSFALRESLLREGGLDPDAPGGLARGVRRLGALWLVCAGVGVLGAIMIRYTGSLAAGLPYLAGSAALFVVHAPRAGFLARLRGGGAP